MSIFLGVVIISIVSYSWGEEEKLIQTTRYIALYGHGDLKVGDMVTVYDQSDVLCGRFKVHEPGSYGMMAVFGDDFLSSDVDEGAEEGEVLVIKVNGEIVYPAVTPVWENEGQNQRVDLD